MARSGTPARRALGDAALARDEVYVLARGRVLFVTAGAGLAIETARRAPRGARLG